MRKIELLIVHCSASDNPEQDNIEAVRELHTALKIEKFKWGKYKTRGRGWSDVGYHYFIQKDGTIEKGRPIHLMGAHTLGHNHNSIGICFSGDVIVPTKDQLKSWAYLEKELLRQFGLKKDSIYPHSFFDRHKSCPNFDIELLK